MKPQECDQSISVLFFLCFKCSCCIVSNIKQLPNMLLFPAIAHKQRERKKNHPYNCSNNELCHLLLILSPTHLAGYLFQSSRPCRIKVSCLTPVSVTIVMPLLFCFCCSFVSSSVRQIKINHSAPYDVRFFCCCRFFSTFICRQFV